VKTNHTFLFHERNSRQNHKVKIVMNLLKSDTVQQFGNKLTQNCIHEETKSRLKLGNSFYHLVQNILFSSLLSKNIKI